MPKNLTDFDSSAKGTVPTVIPFPAGLARPDQTHVDRKVYKMRELQNAGVVRTILVPTKDMRADMLTKPLDDETFARHRDTIMNTGALATRPYGNPSGNHSGSGGV